MRFRCDKEEEGEVELLFHGGYNRIFSGSMMLDFWLNSIENCEINSFV